MNNLRYLLEKEFKQIFRNSMILRLILVMPIIQLIIIPMAADYEVKHIRLAVVDQDQSPYSEQLANRLAASNYLDINQYTHTYEEALEQVELGKIDLVLTIPADFERSLISESHATIAMAADAVNPVKAGMGSSYAAQIIRTFNNDIRKEWILLPDYPPLPIIEIESAHWYNPHIRYVDFMAPGILGVLVTMVGAFLTALNIVAEKETGTIEQLNVTPLKKWQFIIGKLTPFWVLGLVSLTMGVIVSWIIFGLWPEGSLLTLYVVSMLYLISVLGIGLLVSTFAETQQQAILFAFFIMMVFILMSGLYTPVESMPDWAQWVAKLNPPTYFIRDIRAIYLKGSTLMDLRADLLIYAAFAIVFNTAAIWNYKKRAA